MLKISLAVLADAANISKEGKLNLTGIFNNINAVNFPASHPWMVLVFLLEGDRSDAISEHKLKIDMIDEDGNLVIPSIEGAIKFTVGPQGDIYAPQILQLANIQFKKSGRHEFKIIINGEVRASVPINVIKLESTK